LKNVYKVSSNTLSLTAEIQAIGEDVLVIVPGGKAHIGALSLSQFHTNENSLGMFTSTTSTLSAFGHKDDTLSALISKSLSKKLKKSIACIVGIHFDNLTHEQLNEIITLAENLVDSIKL